MERVRTGVVGVGHFGRYHSQKYAMLPDSDLVALVDANLGHARTVAEPLGCAAYDDPSALIGQVDAVSIAVPTKYHYAVARPLLEAGIHCLIEKPIAAEIDEARELVAVAEASSAILQVGHLERFNPSILALEDVLGTPLFVDSIRISGFQPRVTDVNVVLDLMIHDIDLIQHLVGRPLLSVESCGVPVLSALDDIVNARLHFEGGCIANVTASRISLKTERKMRLFQSDCYISIDFVARHATIARKGSGEMYPGVPNIELTHRSFDASDALLVEIRAFLDAVQGKIPVKVTGADGVRALETAMKITNSLIRPELTESSAH